jgi:hypothetical protein
VGAHKRDVSISLRMESPRNPRTKAKTNKKRNGKSNSTSQRSRAHKLHNIKSLILKAFPKALKLIDVVK